MSDCGKVEIMTTETNSSWDLRKKIGWDLKLRG